MGRARLVIAPNKILQFKTNHIVACHSSPKTCFNMDVLVSVSVNNATQNAMFTLIMGMGMADIEHLLTVKRWRHWKGYKGDLQGLLLASRSKNYRANWSLWHFSQRRDGWGEIVGAHQVPVIHWLIANYSTFLQSIFFVASANPVCSKIEYFWCAVLAGNKISIFVCVEVESRNTSEIKNKNRFAAWACVRSTCSFQLILTNETYELKHISKLLYPWSGLIAVCYCIFSVIVRNLIGIHISFSPITSRKFILYPFCTMRTLYP